ncbi:unnamed protein product, partial [Rangifer tarandus platyrhynchus]
TKGTDSTSRIFVSVRRRKWQPTPAFLPGGFHGQSGLAGYRPRGHRESDTTEPVSLCL